MRSANSVPPPLRAFLSVESGANFQHLKQTPSCHLEDTHFNADLLICFHHKWWAVVQIKLEPRLKAELMQ